jgi:hypothetical protein
VGEDLGLGEDVECRAAPAKNARQLADGEGLIGDAVMPELDVRRRDQLGDLVAVLPFVVVERPLEVADKLGVVFDARV